jgi:hypothetical protein
MAAAGVQSPVWITEFGYTSCTIGSDRWCVSEQQQADYLAQATRLVATWPWVRSFLVYNLRDKGSDPTSTEDNFGLVRHDLTAKPALTALGTAFAAVANGSPDPTDSTGLTPVASTSATDAAADESAPAVRMAPRHRFGQHRRLTWAWSGHDRGAGVSSYDVRYRSARWGGHFTPYRHARHATTATRMVVHTRRGSEMCVSVRARDQRGNVSAWTADECKALVLDARAAGATVQRRHARGRTFSIVATRCRTCGHVDVWVGHHLIARHISLHAKRTEHRQIIRLPELNRVVRGTVLVRSSDRNRRLPIHGFGARRG